MIAKRDNCYCVLHGHPKKLGSKTDKPKGSVIKCFCGPNMKANLKKAQGMHYAIRKSQKR